MKEKYEEELKAQEKMNQIQKTLADNTSRKDKVRRANFLNYHFFAYFPLFSFS